MNWDQIEGNWKEFKGKAKEKWGEITDDELDQAEGKRDQLVGLVQQKYGKAREEAEREVDAWIKSRSNCPSSDLHRHLPRLLGGAFFMDHPKLIERSTKKGPENPALSN